MFCICLSIGVGSFLLTNSYYTHNLQSCPSDPTLSPSTASPTDLLPAVIALGVALSLVTVLLAVAISIIVLQYIRESHCTSTLYTEG